MRNILMLGATAAMIAVMPSLADAQGRGKGHGGPHATTHAAHGPNARVRTDRRIAAGNPHGCPPGLANRNPPCVPPGQANRLFREGQRLPVNYNYYTPYSQIPLDVRSRFSIPDGYRYVYRDDAVYVVDPTTRLVRSIIDLID